MKKVVSTLVLFALALLAAPHAARAEATVGKPAPPFVLSDQDGKPVDLARLSGKIVVLEWTNPQCPFVQRHYAAKTMTTLADRFGKDGVVWLAINSSHSEPPELDKDWRNKQGIAYPVLNDRAGTVGRQYGAQTTPHMFVIDGKGTLVYAGAIDDDPAGGEGASAVNYVAQALEDTVAGKPVRTPQTKPYGCSVKYGT